MPAPRETRAAVLEELGRARPYRESAPLRIETLQLDPPGPGELLVRIDVAGLCHSDLSVVDGSRPRPVPMALGHEAAATVVEAGAGLEGQFSEGDRCVLVFVPECGRCGPCRDGRPPLCERGAAANTAGELLRGGRRLHRDGEQINHHLGASAFAEYAVVDAGSAVPVPADVPVEVAALMGCAVLTGVGAVLNTAQVRPGDRVAVFGLGGVGLAAVLGAVVAGAGVIVAVDPVSAKRELAVELGATRALAPDRVRDGLREFGLTGVDVAVEAVGSAQVLGDAFGATVRGGLTVAVGLPHPSQELRLPAVQLVAEARRIVGSYMGSAVPRRDIPRLLALWRAGRLPVERLVSGRIELEGLNGALDELAEGRAVRQLVLPHGRGRS